MPPSSPSPSPSPCSPPPRVASRMSSSSSPHTSPSASNIAEPSGRPPRPTYSHQQAHAQACAAASLRLSDASQLSWPRSSGSTPDSSNSSSSSSSNTPSPRSNTLPSVPSVSVRRHPPSHLSHSHVHPPPRHHTHASPSPSPFQLPAHHHAGSPSVVSPNLSSSPLAGRLTPLVSTGSDSDSGAPSTLLGRQQERLHNLSLMADDTDLTQRPQVVASSSASSATPTQTGSSSPAAASSSSPFACSPPCLPATPLSLKRSRSWHPTSPPFERAAMESSGMAGPSRLRGGGQHVDPLQQLRVSRRYSSSDSALPSSPDSLDSPLSDAGPDGAMLSQLNLMSDTHGMDTTADAAVGGGGDKRQRDTLRARVVSKTTQPGSSMSAAVPPSALPGTGSGSSSASANSSSSSSMSAKHFKRAAHSGHQFARPFPAPAGGREDDRSPDADELQQGTAAFAPHQVPRQHHSAFQHKRAQAQRNPTNHISRAHTRAAQPHPHAHAHTHAHTHTHPHSHAHAPALPASASSSSLSSNLSPPSDTVMDDMSAAAATLASMASSGNSEPARLAIQNATAGGAGGNSSRPHGRQVQLQHVPPNERSLSEPQQQQQQHQSQSAPPLTLCAPPRTSPRDSPTSPLLYQVALGSDGQPSLLPMPHSQDAAQTAQVHALTSQQQQQQQQQQHQPQHASSSQHLPRHSPPVHMHALPPPMITVPHNPARQSIAQAQMRPMTQQQPHRAHSAQQQYQQRTRAPLVDHASGGAPPSLFPPPPTHGSTGMSSGASYSSDGSRSAILHSSNSSLGQPPMSGGSSSGNNSSGQGSSGGGGMMFRDSSSGLDSSSSGSGGLSSRTNSERELSEESATSSNELEIQKSRRNSHQQMHDDGGISPSSASSHSSSCGSHYGPRSQSPANLDPLAGLPSSSSSPPHGVCSSPLMEVSSDEDPAAAMAAEEELAQLIDTENNRRYTQERAARTAAAKRQGQAEAEGGRGALVLPANVASECDSILPSVSPPAPHRRLQLQQPQHHQQHSHGSSQAPHTRQQHAR